MASQNDFFKITGNDHIAKELDALSRGMKNKILRSPMTKGAAEIRKVAKRIVKTELNDTGLLHKMIKSKTFTKKSRGKGLVSHIGVLNVKNQDGYYPKKGNEKKPRPISLVANVHNNRVNFLDRALNEGNARATQVLITETQKKIDEFHAKNKQAGTS